MRRGILIVGLVLLVIFGFFAWIAYAAGQTDCATNFLGQEANSSACSSDGGLLLLSIFVIIIALILVILGAILKSKETPATAAPPPMVAPAGAPSGKVCLRCGAYYPEPVPAFCSKCGGSVGVIGTQTGLPPPPPP